MTKKEKLLNMSDSKLDKEVKIGGTDYDRHVKINAKMVNTAKKMAKSGKKLSAIASKLGVSTSAIKYRIDENYKKVSNANRYIYGWNHSGQVCTFEDRVDYKRELVKAGKIK